MPPKGFKTITVTKKQHARLIRMKRGLRLGSVGECIDELLKFTIY